MSVPTHNLGGTRGIRTPGRRKPTPVFKTGAFVRSAIVPLPDATETTGNRNTAVNSASQLGEFETRKRLSDNATFFRTTIESKKVVLNREFETCSFSN